MACTGIPTLARVAPDIVVTTRLRSAAGRQFRIAANRPVALACTYVAPVARYRDIDPRIDYGDQPTSGLQIRHDSIDSRGRISGQIVLGNLRRIGSGGVWHVNRPDADVEPGIPRRFNSG